MIRNIVYACHPDLIAMFVNHIGALLFQICTLVHLH
jgi:hypothetical protein